MLHFVRVLPSTGGTGLGLNQISCEQIDSCLQVVYFALEAGNSAMSKAGTENVSEELNSIPGSFSDH